MSNNNVVLPSAEALVTEAKTEYKTFSTKVYLKDNDGDSIGVINLWHSAIEEEGFNKEIFLKAIQDGKVSFYTSEPPKAKKSYS